jgi:ubiquitin C-terminal hydrolase
LIKSYKLRSTNLFPLLCVQSGKFGKISKAIRFPETLNLSSYMSTRDDNSPVYSLYGVVVHHDVMNAAFSGHYVCYVKDTHGKWYKTDDSQVCLPFRTSGYVSCLVLVVFRKWDLYTLLD